jgi:hypothetical protein
MTKNVRELEAKINSAPLLFTSHLQSGPYEHPHLNLVGTPPEDLTHKYCIIYKLHGQLNYYTKANGDTSYDTKKEANEALKKLLSLKLGIVDYSICECDFELTEQGRKNHELRNNELKSILAKNSAPVTL